MRIDKFLSNMGFGSRKEVKKLLKAGVVHVNEKIIKDPSFHLSPEEDTVTAGGETIKYKKYIYLMLHKPAGVISATEDVRESTVIDLLDEEDIIFDPFPVGRLDKDTEGLLLLTNDGQLAHQLLSPKKHVPKTYYAEIRGEVSVTDIEAFRKGVTLDDGYFTKPGELEIIEAGDHSKILLTITEGKFHQVKRMFEAVNKKVIYLKRMKMGKLVLDENLDKGEYRELTDEEISLLQDR